jgi:RNA polymerase sigma-70 factor (ECF subfamily)
MAVQHTTESVWSKLSSDLRRFIRRRVDDDHVADDLLQETFVRIHCNLESLTGSDRLAAWVYQIARNVIRDHYRKSQRHMVSLADNPDLADHHVESNGKFRGRTSQWLEELINQLPENYREPLRLAEVEGISQQEVANRLGLSLSGAKSRVQRGRALLRNELEQCCTFQFDRRGNLLDVSPRPDRKACRGCDEHTMC